MFTDTRTICHPSKGARAERRRAFVAQLRENAPLLAAINIRETPLSVVITTTDQHADTAVCHLANRAADSRPTRVWDRDEQTATITVRF